MSEQTLHVVDDRPRASAIIHVPPPGKMAASGDGPDRLLCGSCSTVLADGVGAGELAGNYIQCPKCGSMNEVAM
jgi:ribosomal protein S27AE